MIIYSDHTWSAAGYQGELYAKEARARSAFRAKISSDAVDRAALVSHAAGAPKSSVEGLLDWVWRGGGPGLAASREVSILERWAKND